jgi:hypothetical protein
MIIVLCEVHEYFIFTSVELGTYFCLSLTCVRCLALCFAANLYDLFPEKTDLIYAFA